MKKWIVTKEGAESRRENSTDEWKNTVIQSRWTVTNKWTNKRSARQGIEKTCC